MPAIEHRGFIIETEKHWHLWFAEWRRARDNEPLGQVSGKTEAEAIQNARDIIDDEVLT